MSLKQGIVDRFAKLLKESDEHSAPHHGVRLSGDACRLCKRLFSFIEMRLVGPQIDTDALELACYALQLPSRQIGISSSGKFVRMSLRDRCEQAAELMVSLFANHVDETLLDRAARLLHEAPQRSPMLDEARLLADAVNLDDFGVIGLLNQAIQLSLQGEGIAELAVAAEKREQYGYWEARLKDGFHFEPVRQIAHLRLAEARQINAMLFEQLGEDRKS